MIETTCVFRDNMDADIIENHSDKTIVKRGKNGTEVEIAPGQNKVMMIIFLK